MGGEPGAAGGFAQLLLGVCCGVMLAMAAAMLRAPRPTARWTGFGFFLSSAVFALKLWADDTQALAPELRGIVGVISMSSVGWFWLMVKALFQDRDRFPPWMYAAPLLMAACAVAHYIGMGLIWRIVWAGTATLQVTLAASALWTVVRSWKDDLIEQRRRVRGPFMVAVALYILSLNGFDIWNMVGETPAWYPMVNAGLLTLCTLGGAIVFLEASPSMFGEARAQRQPEPPPAARTAAVPSLSRATPGKAELEPVPTAMLEKAARADLERLACLMSSEQVWREEGLTIASLARRAAMPEAHLRRLISDRLGYRNFPSYVNAHRIAAAKSRLADPTAARVSISAIAFETGFASLAPFNRAFREEEGVSPSEWRRKILGEASPIPEQA